MMAWGMFFKFSLNISLYVSQNVKAVQKLSAICPLKYFSHKEEDILSDKAASSICNLQKQNKMPKCMQSQKNSELSLPQACYGHCHSMIFSLMHTFFSKP